MRRSYRWAPHFLFKIGYIKQPDIDMRLCLEGA